MNSRRDPSAWWPIPGLRRAQLRSALVREVNPVVLAIRYEAASDPAPSAALGGHRPGQERHRVDAELYSVGIVVCDDLIGVREPYVRLQCQQPRAHRGVQRLGEVADHRALPHYVPSPSSTAAAPVAATFLPKYTSVVMEVFAWPS